MTKLVLEKLNKSNINVINCREQPYNNASNMSGSYKGMQAEIKKLNASMQVIVHVLRTC